jgi:hypothetical protein
MNALCMVRPGVYSHFCPGCQCCHTFNVHDVNQDGKVIGYDGDPIRPSLGQPLRHVGADGAVCEYILRAGVIHYLESCSHELRGQSRALIDCPN